jgi:tetratricopeptide (TPR) repeat protein
MRTSGRMRFLSSTFTLWLLLTFIAPVITAQALPQDNENAQLARAQKAEEAGDYRTAETIYLELLRRNPGLLPVEFKLGVTYHLDHKYVESSVYLLKVLDAQPDLFPAVLLTGIDFFKLGNLDRAIPLLRRARRLRPADEYASHNLANAEYLAGDYQGAFADYLSFLRSEGKTADVLSWYGIGEVSILLSHEASSRLSLVPPSDPNRLRFLAAMYRDQEQWDLAIAKLKALETQPSWRDWAKLQMGEIYLHERKLPQAAKQFDQVLLANSESAGAHFGLGVTLLLTGNTGDALPHLVAAAQRSPWLFANPEWLARDEGAIGAVNGEVSALRSNGSALVNSFIKMLAEPSLGKNEAQSTFLLELRTACERRHQENEQSLRIALRSGPPPGRLLDLVNDLLEEGDAAAASELLSKLSDRLAGEHDHRSILRARVAVAAGDVLAGGFALLSVIKDSRSQESSYWIAILMQRIAQTALDQVLTLAPEGVYSHLLRAQMESTRGRTDAAIREFQLAVQVAPDDATTHFKLGDMLWQAGRFEDAIVALRAGLNLDPQNAAAYYQIGDSYLSLSEPAMARDFLSKAVGYDPRLDAAYKDLGKIYYQEKRFQESVAVLQKATHDKSDSSTYYLLFRAYYSLGNKEAAGACLKRFQELQAHRENKLLFDADVARRETPATEAPSIPPSRKDPNNF